VPISTPGIPRFDSPRSGRDGIGWKSATLDATRLAALRTSAKAQIHAVMAKLGILPTMSDMFGPTGQGLLDEMLFEGAYAIRVDSLRGLLERYERELVMVEHHQWLIIGIRPRRTLPTIWVHMCNVSRVSSQRDIVRSGTGPGIRGGGHCQLPPSGDRGGGSGQVYSGWRRARQCLWSRPEQDRYVATPAHRPPWLAALR
jgi:hypothetical protein